MIILKSSISLYSTENGEIKHFLTSYYNKEILLDNNLKHVIFFDNPIEMTSMIGTFIENIEDYKINMWISLDKHIYINITQNNVDKIIRYIYERFPC